MRIAAYLRVSTKEQEYANQLPAVLAYAAARGWPEPVIFAENESAFLAGHQKELARLLKELRAGKKYDFLIVFALDRFTRGTIREVIPLIDSFERLGCKLVSVKEEWIADSGPMRDIFILFNSWAAHYESVRKQQNTRAGIARKRKENPGKLWGRRPGQKDKKPRRRRRLVVSK